MLLVIIVDVLLLQVRRRGMHSSKLIVIVAILEILHLEKIIITTRLLIDLLLMHGLPHCLILQLLLLLLSIHLNHVITLRFGGPDPCF